MANTQPTLHMLCGKIAAGKSTLAAKLASEHGTVLIAEDEWLSDLFSDQMSTGQDYLRYAAKLRQAMAPHIRSLLNEGLCVVLDFQANTVESRRWMRSLLEGIPADHQLHVLAPSDEVCLERLHARNAAGRHAFAISDAQFHQFSKHFVLPTPDEGFNLVHHS